MFKEIEIQEQIIEKLGERDLYPFSVVFSFESPDGGGILSITFHFEQDLTKLLDILKYKSQCDKSGWLIMDKNNTIILTGLALLNLYTNL
jgi:hypothetical protein